MSGGGNLKSGGTLCPRTGSLLGPVLAGPRAVRLGAVEHPARCVLRRSQTNVHARGLFAKRAGAGFKFTRPGSAPERGVEYPTRSVLPRTLADVHGGPAVACGVHVVLPGTRTALLGFTGAVPSVRDDRCAASRVRLCSHVSGVLTRAWRVDVAVLPAPPLADAIRGGSLVHHAPHAAFRVVVRGARYVRLLLANLLAFPRLPRLNLSAANRRFAASLALDGLARPVVVPRPGARLRGPPVRGVPRADRDPFGPGWIGDPVVLWGVLARSRSSDLRFSYRVIRGPPDPDGVPHGRTHEGE